MLIAVALVALVLVGVVVWLGSSWLGTYRDAEAAQAEVEQLRQSLADQEWEAALEQVPQAAASARALADSTSSGAWSALSAAPGVGATASATEALAASMASVLTAAESLIPYGDAVLAGELRDESGAIRTSLVTEAVPLLESLAASLDSASASLSSIDVSQVREPVASAVTEFAGLAGEYSGTVAGAADVAGRVPSLLGAEGPRDWLVLLQNPAEARGAGGFPGGYVILRVDEGRISVASSGTSADLRKTAIPVSVAPEDSQTLWGTELDAWDTFNLSPHFPLTGELAAAGMAARGTPVTGVIALDPAVVAALMTVTGPVTARGQTITAENVEQFFLRDIYSLYAEDAERDAVTMALVGSVISAFLSAPLEPVALADALRAPVAEGRLRVWSGDADEQAWFASMPVGGVIPSTPGPIVAVAFNNAAGSKMDAFVESAIAYEPGMCPSSAEQESRLSVFLRNGAPSDLPVETQYYGRMDDPAAPEGSTSLLVHVYLPLDAVVTSATLDGAPLEWLGGDEQGHPVAWFRVALDRDQQRSITFDFTEPTVPGVEPRVIVQPMAIGTETSVSPDPTCP